jgi:hypothetical protein
MRDEGGRRKERKHWSVTPAVAGGLCRKSYPSATADATDKLRLLEPMSLKTWIKKLGFWGFVFFLLKGLLWLTIPALIAIFAE